MSEANGQFSRDEFQLLYDGMVELIGAYGHAIERSTTAKMAELLDGRRQKCEAIGEKLAKAIVGEDGE